MAGLSGSGQALVSSSPFLSPRSLSLSLSLHSRLVDNNNRVRALGREAHNVLKRDALRRRVPWAAHEDQLCVSVDGGEHGGYPEVEGGGEGDFFDEHVVDLGADLVHPVSRRRGDDIVGPRRAEDAEQKIYCLITAYTHENILRFTPSNPPHQLLQLKLIRTRVPL